MKPLRIGLAQCRQTASLEVNEQTIFRFLEEAAHADVQILCFPETQTVGYRVDIATPDTIATPDSLHDLHDRIARRCGQLGMACILGTETPVQSAKPYNSALVIGSDGKILG